MGKKFSSDQHRRRVPYRDPRTTFLVVCEGQTEEHYLHFIKGRLGRGTIRVETDRGNSDCMSIVNLAVRHARGDTQRGIDPQRYDQIWVLFDWDEHTDEVRRARQVAEAAGIQVGLSNPNFEVWLLWHFMDYMQCGCLKPHVDAALKKVWPHYVKGQKTNFNELPRNNDDPQQGVKHAIHRAEQARRYFGDHPESFTYPDDRPSTDVDQLLTSIIRAWESSHGPDEKCSLLSE